MPGEGVAIVEEVAVNECSSTSFLVMREDEREISDDRLLAVVTARSARHCALACHGTSLCDSVQVAARKDGSVRCALLADRVSMAGTCPTDADRLLDYEYVVETASRLYCIQCADDELPTIPEGEPFAE